MFLACLVPAGVALAGYQDGGYAGTTEQVEAISFRAAEARVRRLTTNVYAECADGTRQRVTIERGRTEILDDRFELELTGSPELKVSVTGRLRAERAAGRIEAILKPADTTCRADVRWQASLTPGAAVKP